MFLRNFFEYQRALNTAVVEASGTSTDASCVLTTLTILGDNLGQYVYLAGVNGSTSFFQNTNWIGIVEKTWNLFKGLSFRIGTGTTAVESDDYCLDTDVTSSFISTTSNVNMGVSEDGHLTLVVTWSGTNNTANDIVVSEFGVVKTLPMFLSATVGTSQLNSVTNKDFLIGRMILPNPVTIGAGNTGTITVKIEMF